MRNCLIAVSLLVCCMSVQVLFAQEKDNTTAQLTTQENAQKALLERLNGIQEQLKSNPSSPDLLYELTLSYAELGEIERALESMLLTLKNVSSSEGISVQHPIDFQQQDRERYAAAIKQMKLQNNEESIQLLESLKDKYPFSPEVYYNLAIMYGNEAEYVKFFENIYGGAALDRKVVEYYRITGGINVLLGNLKKAESMFGKCIEIDENYAPAYEWLGKLRLLEHKYEEGIYILKKAVTADPQDYSARLTLGRMYMELKQFDEAKKTLEEALEINKNHWEAYRTLGYLYYYMDDVDNSIKMFKEVIVLQPSTIDPLLDLARVYQKKGFNAEAIAHIKSAIKMMPNEPMLYIELADLYAANEDYPMAMESFQQALAIDDDMPVIHYRLGLVHYKMQDFTEAARELKKAIRLESEYIDAYKALYYLYRDELKDDKEAAYYAQMLQILTGNE